MHTIWNDLLIPGVPVIEKVIRTLLVYAFLLIGLRLAGKRELGQLNPFDLVVLLLLSNTVQNAIIGNDDSVSGGLIGAAVLLVVNYLLVRFLYTHPGVDRVIEGDPDVLVTNGEPNEAHLEREMITLPELMAAARRQGIDKLEEIECARLEVGGALSFIASRPSAEERRHRELLDRLTRLEALVSSAAGRRA